MEGRCTSQCIRGTPHAAAASSECSNPCRPCHVPCFAFHAVLPGLVRACEWWHSHLAKNMHISSFPSRRLIAGGREFVLRCGVRGLLVELNPRLPELRGAPLLRWAAQGWNCSWRLKQLCGCSQESFPRV